MVSKDEPLLYLVFMLLEFPPRSLPSFLSLSRSVSPFSWSVSLSRSLWIIIYNICGGEEEGEGVYWTTRRLRTWKQPHHLVCIIGTQIFETSFFVFQTIDRLIYELALEFHCRKATDEKITENEIFVRWERKWIDPHVLLGIPSFSALFGFALLRFGASEWEVSSCHLKKPFSASLDFTLCV